MLKTGLASLLLRLLTSGSRLILLVALGRFLDVADLGRFGLVMVTVQLALYALGLDFYAFNMRELAKATPAEWPRLIRDQLVVHGVTYAAGLPLLLGVFAAGLLPWNVALWFYPVLVGEHLCQELQRILVAIARPVLANVLLFFRSALWVYALVPTLWLAPATRSLTWVFTAWLIGLTAGLSVGVGMLRDLDWASCRGSRPNRRWIRRGLGVALPFLIASVSFRGISAVDRLVLEKTWGEAAVGVFSLFYGIANVLVIAAENGVVNILLPKMVAARDVGEPGVYRSLVRKLGIATAALCGSLALVLAGGIWLVLAIVAKPVFREALGTFWVLLGASVVAALATVPHCVLYAGGHDRALVACAVVGLVVAIVANLLVVPTYGHLGTAYAALAAMTAVMAGKVGYAWRYERRSLRDGIS